MVSLSFSLSLSGLLLQILGISVGGFGVIGERIFNYTPLQALVYLLPGLLPVQDTISIPLFRSLSLTDELQRDSDSIYNKWNVILALLLIISIAVSILGVAYILPLLRLASIQIGIQWLIFWLILVSGINILSAIVAIKITSKQISTHRKIILRFIVLQLRYWIYVPLIGVVMMAILLLQIVMHFFAWVTILLPSKYTINLASRESRQRYYSIYSLGALLLGTILLLLALLLEK